jgi:hypothetical protein
MGDSEPNRWQWSAAVRRAGKGFFLWVGPWRLAGECRNEAGAIQIGFVAGHVSRNGTFEGPEKCGVGVLRAGHRSNADD